MNGVYGQCCGVTDHTVDNVVCLFIHCRYPAAQGWHGRKAQVIRRKALGQIFGGAGFYHFPQMFGGLRGGGCRKGNANGHGYDSRDSGCVLGAHGLVATRSHGSALKLAKFLLKRLGAAQTCVTLRASVNSRVLGHLGNARSRMSAMRSECSSGVLEDWCLGKRAV